MERGTFKHIEQILRDYPNLESYIHQRRQELLYPHRQIDDNIGGGKQVGGDNPVENMYITIADDKQIASLERNRKVIGRCLESCDEDTHIIINEMYFKRHPTLTMRGIAESIHSSRTVVSRKRTEFFEEIRKELGW